MSCQAEKDFLFENKAIFRSRGRVWGIFY
jgi:hypothetical protein